MADSQIAVTEGSGKNVDTRTNAAGDHRQVIVVGNPTATDSVAEVQATDPSSNALGLVVRDVNTSALVSRLGSTLFVQLDPGHTLGAVTIGGTMAVYFDQSNPSVKANAGTGSFNVQFDPGHTLGKVDAGLGTFNVQLDPGHTLGSVLVNPGTGTLNVQFDPGHELGTIKGNSNTLTVFLPDTGHEIGTIRGNTNTLTVFLPDTGHTIGKVDAGTGTFTVKLDPSSKIAGSDSSLSVYLSATAGTLGVRVGQVDGTVAVYFSQSKPIVLADSQHTASIFTVAGSTSGVSASGVTLVSPSANASFKVFAFSLQTTGIVSVVARFTNGAGSATEFFRGLVTSNQTSSTPVGANLAVQPPGFLFATGVSTTLALHLDTATLVHYSVSYIKESA